MRLPSEAELAQLLATGAKAMCVVAGKVSGNLEVQDFDCQAEVFERWLELVDAEAPDLIARLLIERSQSGGKHVVYRLDGVVPGSMKLAEKVCVCADTDSAVYKGKKYVARRVQEHYEFYPVLVETKGEGGLFLCAPSPGYVLEQGSFENLPTITADEREVLIRCARSFNEKMEMAPSPKVPSAAGGRPGDDFNERGDIRDILRRNGWTLVRKSGDNEFWRRPGKDDGWSATYNGKVFYCFTSSASPFEPDQGYSKFHVYALLEHSGDYSAAASTLRSQRYGASTPSVPAKTDVQVVCPDPLPLDDPRPPAMPAGLLPGWPGMMAEKISEATETPLELPALLCLSAIATAAQGRFSVSPEPGYSEPVNIWVAPTLKSGERKTAVHTLAARPLIDWEQEKCQEVTSQRKTIELEIKNVEARTASLRNRFAKEDDAIQQRRLQEEIALLDTSMPQLPIMPRLFTQDVTPEHLGTMMVDQNGRMAILSDEGGIFDVLAGRYSGGIPNLDLFLQAHSGAPVRVDRGSRPPVVLDYPLLTIGLSPQPDVLRSLSDKPGFRGRGLLARFLYALPESKVGRRDLVPRPIPGHVVERYARGIRALLEIPPRHDEQKDRFLPHVLAFDEAAYRVWKDHQRRVEVELREGGRFAGMTDWAGKLPGAVARLAALSHCAQYVLETPGPADRRIGVEVMQCAVRFGEILAEHALLVFDLMSDNGATEAARKVWRHIRSTEMTSFTFSQIWHPLRGTFKTTEEIEPAVDILLDHYLILPVEDRPSGQMGRRGRRFLVNPRIPEGWGT